MAYLAAVILLATGIGVLAPIFAACAAIVRLRTSPPVIVTPAQRRIDLSILLLAALGPILWLEAFLLRNSRKGSVPFALVVLLLLCALAGLALAATNRGVGRSLLLAAHALFLTGALGLAIWAALSTHLDRNRPFFSHLVTPLRQPSRPTPRTRSNIPSFSP